MCLVMLNLFQHLNFQRCERPLNAGLLGRLSNRPIGLGIIFRCHGRDIFPVLDICLRKATIGPRIIFNIIRTGVTKGSAMHFSDAGFFVLRRFRWSCSDNAFFVESRRHGYVGLWTKLIPQLRKKGGFLFALMGLDPATKLCDL